VVLEVHRLQEEVEEELMEDLEGELMEDMIKEVLGLLLVD
jgi:hypothetical protein